MKKISIAMALIFSLAATSAFACPKGTYLVGGTGPNHKGGKCVATDGKANTKSDAKANDKSAKKQSKKDRKKSDTSK